MGRMNLLEATEAQECIAFLDWCALVSFDGVPLIERVVKIPNERNKRSVMTAVLAKLGMRRGFPDYVILVPMADWHGLFLEAKRATRGKVDREQEEWRDRLRSWGYAAEICAGASEMIRATRNYFGGSAGRFVDRTTA
jgi:hypothetical protein